MFNSINGTDIIFISSEQFGSDNVRTSELMTGMAQGRRVYFFSKPIIGMTKKPTFFYRKESHKTTVVQPYLPSDLSIESYEKDLIKLMKEFIHDEHISHLTIWTDTVNAAPFIRELKPEVSVYDRAGEFRNMTADITIDSRDSYYSLHNNIEELNFDEHMKLLKKSIK